MKKSIDRKSDLHGLAALGFGPDSTLIKEPKLLVDSRFLATLLAEFEAKLGPEETARTLFQIGLMRGLRDANQALQRSFASARPDEGEWLVTINPLAMRLAPNQTTNRAGGHAFQGCWPEAFEAAARLSKLGPAGAPSCALSAGYTSGWLSGTVDVDILVIEQECNAAGDAGCEFKACEVSEWRASGDARALSLLETLQFELFRGLAASEQSIENDARAGEHPAKEQEHGEFDPDASIVHVWGPVMVVPFDNPNDGLQTVELLSRDPETADVRVVVIDLRDALLDAGFGAAALERALETTESWGAEAILTGVSLLSEAVVADLERDHLVIRKDLPEAIAAAFQIADAQRHLL